ncbi:N-acetylglucosamine-6-phosphate deacetylase [Limosilactobacillus antri]|uniref:N-acetylglucosamine-6-phosphate deacetylase n=1 Tax=Limosilactobacillus antri TaxID=227943 RepID=UPI001F594EFF|nr:N-acetylglucosamine-6-phosphate deacetylase [Limosilactobacillus antri]
MQTVIKNADIYVGNGVIHNGYLRFAKKVIAVGPMAEYAPQEADEQVVDGSEKIVVPGFIDVHTHGGYGIDTMDADPAKVNEMICQEAKNEGITSIFPTTVTQSVANISQAMKVLKVVNQENPVMQGIHLEGPFISAEYKGAQPEPYIINPDAKQLKEWNELSGGLIKVITYAPEQAGAADVESYCQEHEIVLSVGHSSAKQAQLEQSKATHITHLYNAQRPMHHREPGVTGEALLEKKFYTEIIADGYHVAPDMVDLAYRLKGPDKIELITDSLRAKGMPEGISELGGQKVIVKDHQARLENGHLAGSVLKYALAFKNIISFTGCSISDAVKMTSYNQAQEFKLESKGGLTVGKDADLNVLDQALNLEATYSYGQRL